jgi:regulator of RNase E activity RraA
MADELNRTEHQLGVGTSTLSDALDRLGRTGAVPGIQPFDNTFSVCGPAFTLHYEPIDSAGGTVGDYIDDVPPGAVIVIDNQGRLDCTVWGDILTMVAHTRGIGGTVIDGVCRDVARSVAVRYPVFSRGRSMQTGKDRVRLARQQTAVQLGSVTVCPGDIVVGDSDGVVVVSSDAIDEVGDVAREIELAEEDIRVRVARGERLDHARQAAGYHRLQSRTVR